MRKPADAMSKGLNSSNLAAAAQQRHPIDRMQRGGFVRFISAIDSYCNYINITPTHQMAQYFLLYIATASNGATESPLDLDAIRRLYGSGLAMRLATERQMALKVGGRLPGLDAHPDSRAMYETLTGDDVSIGFGDYLNLRRNRPEGGDFGGAFDVPHTSMEHKLGL